MSLERDDALDLAETGQAAVTTDPLAETGEAPVEQVPAPRLPDPMIGKTLDGRYLIEATLGEGGMGVVYRGKHKVIDKKVAIKILRGEMARDKEMTDRFLQEAKAASSIGNPHIVDISDFGILPGGETYFVMEYLNGVGLGDAMSTDRPMKVVRLVHIAKQVAQGLSAAHTAGIVHRDLKPDNVILINRGVDKDFVKVLDFGIAKVGGEASKITRAGSVFGTPHYMSPEQAAGGQVDLRTDIYALGVILYEMAAGKVPFDADNFMGILTQHMYKAPVPIRALVPQPQPDMPPGLDAIILKCLSKKSDGRYATMDELVEDLERLEKGQLPRAVDEMMARSGGFNVPADYFRSAAMPISVPGSPPRSAAPRWPLYALIGTVMTALGVLILAAIISITTTSARTPVAVREIPTAAPPPPVPAPVVAAPSKLILLGVEPRDAKLTRAGKDLGTQPLALTMAAGDAPFDIQVSRQGYVTQTIKVDGNEPKPFVKLAPVVVPGKPQVKPAAGTQTQTPKPNVDEFKDPFLKK
ncbi:MAG: serine/threonine-protein kinase [Polyangiaceae bacterium]